MTMEEVEADLDVELEPKEAQEEEAEHAFWDTAKMLGFAVSLQPEFVSCVGIIGRLGVPPKPNLAAALENERKRILGQAADALFWGSRK